MNFNPKTVKSMGFKKYCINYAVNIMENGDLKDGYKYEDETHSVVVMKCDKMFAVTIKAYIDGLGWKTEEVVI